MTPRTPILAALLGLAALAAVPTRAAATGPDGVVPAASTPDAGNPNVGIDEHIGAQVPLDLVFRDESERPITLREATQGKVTILVPVYFRCPMLCTKVLNGLLDALKNMPMDFNVGDKFNVVTVSMDPKEHADLGAPKRAAYVGEYGRPGAEAGWRFLTGKKEAVGELLGTVGYRYEFDKAFKEYNHPSGIIILTPQGKVARYFYGIGYDGEFAVPGGTTTLRLSLVEASDGKIGSLSDRLMLVCYRFDHLSKGYSLSVMRVVQLGGVLTLLALGAGVTISLRRERRRAAGAAGGVGAVAHANPQNGQPEGTA